MNICFEKDGGIICSYDIMSTQEKQATPKAAFVFLVPLENEQPAQQATKRVSAGSRYNEHKKRLFVQISLKQPYNILTGLCNMEELQLRGLMLQ